MSVRRRSRLAVTSVATAVVATGLLLGTAGPSASAATPTTLYSCTFPELDEVEVPLALDVTNLPATLPVGVPVPAGQWDVAATLRLDDLTTSFLVGQGTNAIRARIGHAELMLGDEPLLVDLASGVEALPLAEPLDVPMTGGNSAFTPRSWADDVPLEMPGQFTLDLADAAGSPLVSAECEWRDGGLGVVGDVSVVKQSASMSRKVLTKPVRPSKRAKVRVAVVSQTGRGAPGEVLASVRGRSVAVGTLADGQVVLRLPKLAAGKHRVTLRYLGSRFVDKTSRTVTVKVVEP